MRVVVEEELEHLSCGAATRLAVKFIELTITADVIKSVVKTERALLRLAADATEYAVIGLAVEAIGYNTLKVAIDAIQ